MPARRQRPRRALVVHANSPVPKAPAEHDPRYPDMQAMAGSFSAQARIFKAVPLPPQAGAATPEASPEQRPPARGLVIPRRSRNETGRPPLQWTRDCRASSSGARLEMNGGLKATTMPCQDCPASTVPGGAGSAGSGSAMTSPSRYSGRWLATTTAPPSFGS